MNTKKKCKLYMTSSLQATFKIYTLRTNDLLKLDKKILNTSSILIIDRIKQCVSRKLVRRFNANLKTWNRLCQKAISLNMCQLFRIDFRHATAAKHFSKPSNLFLQVLFHLFVCYYVGTMFAMNHFYNFLLKMARDTWNIFHILLRI